MPRAGRETLAAVYDDWWRLHASRLSSNTQRTYKAVWTAHVKGRFDFHPVGELAADPQPFDELIADMRARVPAPTHSSENYPHR